jgi:hypothetical protein
VYLDFAKAFDKVPHQRLLKKLRAYGIQGKYLAWIENFFRNRKQGFVLGKAVSDWVKIFLKEIRVDEPALMATPS